MGQIKCGTKPSNEVPYFCQALRGIGHQAKVRLLTYMILDGHHNAYYSEYFKDWGFSFRNTLVPNSLNHTFMAMGNQILNTI